MVLTQRFGLSRFGGLLGGAISDDGGKFSDADRATIDRVLAALEHHAHTGGVRLANPDAGPGLTLDTVGGQLLAGTTYHYRVAYLDAHGLETAAGPEASVATPGPVATPNAPAVITVAGGTLDDGLYWYGLTAVKDGLETLLSPPALVTVTDLRSVQVTWPDGMPVGATGLGVWRQGPLDAGFTRLAEVPAGATEFIDDGSIPADPCACDPDKLPPYDNETNNTNAVTVDIVPAAVASGSGVKAWRIYRSTESGVYDPVSLVAEVVETTVEGGDDLVSTWTDTGASPLASGQPLEVSQALAPSLPVVGTVTASAPLLLAAPGGQVWRVVSGTDGQLVTRMSGGAPPERALILTSPDGGTYRLGITDAGALTTTAASPALADLVYGATQGPVLPTADPTVDHQLRVSDTGALQTVEI